MVAATGGHVDNFVFVGRGGNKVAGPQHSAATRLQRSGIEQATVQDMFEANRFLQQVKKESGQAMRIFSFTTEEFSSDWMERCSVAEQD